MNKGLFLFSLSRLNVPVLWIYFFLILNFHYFVQTLFQTEVVSVLLWTPLAVALLGLTFLKIPHLFRKAPQLVVWIVLLTIFVWSSGYYPERDNDGISFWMPKARALQLFGFLPSVTPADPRFTISHDYPLGMLALSAYVHKFFSCFDIYIHRTTMLFQSLILWWAFFQRSQKLKLSHFRTNLVMLLFVGVQPSLWTHGYLDAPWALAAVLGLSFLLIEKNMRMALPFLFFAQLAKMEASLILICVTVGLAVFQRRPKWLLLAVPAIAWIVTAKFLGLATSRSISFEHFSMVKLGHELWVNTLPLLQFKTLYGGTSVALWAALLSLRGLPKRYLWIPLLAVGIYFSNYAFSTFNLEWNVKFSWARIILFPCFFVVLMRLWGRLPLAKASRS